MGSRTLGVMRALILALAFASVVALAFALALPVDPGAETSEPGPAQPAPGASPLPPSSAGASDAEGRAVARAASQDRGASVVILDYHTFLGKKGNNLDFTPAEFASQLDAMSELGYRFVSLGDAIEGRVGGRANIAITIDDGNHSVYEAWREVMEPRGISPALFVYPAVILNRVPYALTAERLSELSRSGCVIGAHGYNHNPVSDQARAKSGKAYWNEIALPAQAIAGITGLVPVLYAYPFGRASARAKADLAAADYEWAFTADADFGPVDFAAPDLDRMAVHRTIVYRWNYPKLLKALADHLKD